MSTAQAITVQQARDLLKSGNYREVELSFDIDSDDFFNFAPEFRTAGATITRKDGHFVVILPKMDDSIPRF